MDGVDIEFESFLDLDYQTLTFPNENITRTLDHCSGAAILESVPNHKDDIEHIYTSLHKSVDQVLAQISVRTPAQLDQVREQNRRLIDKLTTLEGPITGDPTATSFAPNLPSTIFLSASTNTSGSGNAPALSPNRPKVSPYPRRIMHAYRVASRDSRPVDSQLPRKLDTKVINLNISPATTEVVPVVAFKAIPSLPRSCCKLALWKPEHKSQDSPRN